MVPGTAARCGRPAHHREARPGSTGSAPPGPSPPTRRGDATEARKCLPNALPVRGPEDPPRTGPAGAGPPPTAPHQLPYRAPRSNDIDPQHTHATAGEPALGVARNGQEDLLQVAPRYLAGQGDFSSQDDPLIKEHHWHHWKEKSTTDLYVVSPCHRIRMGFLPECDHPWQMAAAPRPFAATAWSSSFSWDTPLEILAAFHNAVADGLRETPEDRYGERNFAALDEYPYPVAAVLAAAGWTPSFADRSLTWTSPEHLATVALRGDGPGPQGLGMSIKAGKRDWAWEADLDPGVPQHLMLALVTAMTDQRPVGRHRCDLHADQLPHLRINAAPNPLGRSTEWSSSLAAAAPDPRPRTATPAQAIAAAWPLAAAAAANPGASRR